MSSKLCEFIVSGRREVSTGSQLPSPRTKDIWSLEIQTKEPLSGTKISESRRLMVAAASEKFMMGMCSKLLVCIFYQTFNSSIIFMLGSYYHQKMEKGVIVDRKQDELIEKNTAW